MNPTRKLALSSSALNLSRSNANLSNIRASTSNLNTTIFGTPYTPALFSPDQRDKLELRCQKYPASLACLQELLVDQMVATQGAASTEHLIGQDNKDRQLKLQESELVNQIAIIQSKKVTSESVYQLRTQVFESKAFLNTQVMKQVKLLMHLVNSASNKLYLRGNVSKLAQEDFTVMEDLLGDCLGEVKELLKTVGYKEGLKDLANDIKLLKEKHKKVQQYLEVLQKQDNVIGQNTLRVLSDEMAKIL